MMKSILRKIFKLEQLEHPKLFQENVYFVRCQDGKYEAHNLDDGKVIRSPDGEIIRSYESEQEDKTETTAKRSLRERFFDWLVSPPPLTPRQKMREGYFRAKGIRASMKSDRFAPIHVGEREKLSDALGCHTPPLFESQIMLFDPEVDGSNPAWLCSLGVVYENDEQLRNPDIALDFYRQASAWGNSEASYRMGMIYEQGKLVPLDLSVALRYFDLAYEQGYGEISPVHSRVRKVVSDLDSIAASPAVRQEIFALYIHYRDNELGDLPVTSSERLKKLGELIGTIPPQYNDAYALYIEEIDGNNPDWLASIAFILDEHLNNKGLFNPQKAEAFNRKAAELGSSRAAFNLAVKYHSGLETEIDLDEALKWYRKAEGLGGSSAKTRIADILKFQRELDGLTDEDQYTYEIVQLYQGGYWNGDINAAQRYAELFAKRERSPEFAIEIYQWILSRSPSYIEESTHADTAYRMAVRSFLGLATEKSNERALQYLDMIPDQSNHSFVRYYMKEIKQTLKKCIVSEVCFQNDEIELVKGLCETPGDIQETIKKMDAGYMKVSGQLVNYVVWGKWLANRESWSSRYDWNDFEEAVQAHQLKFSFAQAVKSTRDSGPRYNLLDERGLPILGVLIKPSSNEKEEEEQRVTTGSYVPQPGLIRLNSIQANTDGFIYAGHYSEHLPAMLTQEDMEVCEILVFGDPKRGPLFPSLSLETQNNDEYGKGEKGNGYDNAFTYKIFSPQWLAYTDFGRTLWITDYLIGQWCWNPEKFKIGNPENCAAPDLHFKAKDFIKDLRLTGGRDGGASSARVMIQPQSNYILPEAPKEGETVYRQDAASVDIKQMTMKVYGSYILNDGNTENRSLFEEDPNFAQGRTVKKLTDHYNEIMQLDPRFERAQQLMGLFYGHMRLWQIGYRPSEALQKELTAKLRAMETLGRDRDERLLVRRAFGLRPY